MSSNNSVYIDSCIQNTSFIHTPTGYQKHSKFPPQLCSKTPEYSFSHFVLHKCHTNDLIHIEICNTIIKITNFEAKQILICGATIIWNVATGKLFNFLLLHVYASYHT